MPRILPEGEKVVIEPDVWENDYQGKIIIPEPVRDKHQHAQQIGTIVAVGPTVNLLVEVNGERRNVQPGDRVMFIKHAYVSYRNEKQGPAQWIINDGDILGLEVE